MIETNKLANYKNYCIVSSSSLHEAKKKNGQILFMITPCQPQSTSNHLCTWHDQVNLRHHPVSIVLASNSQAQIWNMPMGWYFNGTILQMESQPFNWETGGNVCGGLWCPPQHMYPMSQFNKNTNQAIKTGLHLKKSPNLKRHPSIFSRDAARPAAPLQNFVSIFGINQFIFITYLIAVAFDFHSCVE